MANIFLEKLNLFVAVFLGLMVVGVIIFRVIPSNIATKSYTIDNPVSNSYFDKNTKKRSNGSLNSSNHQNPASSSSNDFYISPEEDFQILQNQPETISQSASSSNLTQTTDNKLTNKASKSYQQEKDEALRKLLINPININTASKNQLDLLPGIGPVTAQKIIDYRNKIGRFTSVDQLIEVKGIGPKKLKNIKPYVRIN